MGSLTADDGVIRLAERGAWPRLAAAIAADASGQIPEKLSLANCCRRSALLISAIVLIPSYFKPKKAFRTA
jgi:hypothetical protein